MNHTQKELFNKALEISKRIESLAAIIQNDLEYEKESNEFYNLELFNNLNEFIILSDDLKFEYIKWQSDVISLICKYIDTNKLDYEKRKLEQDNLSKSQLKEIQKILNEKL
jgi:hypothetical protein